MGRNLDERGPPPGRDRDRRAHGGRAAAPPGHPRTTHRPAGGRVAQDQPSLRAALELARDPPRGKTGGMTTETSREASNGSGPEAAAHAAGRAASAPSSLARMAGRLIGAVASRRSAACRSADLDERDPDYIRETPAAACGCSRASTSAARCAASATSPRTGRVLLVGNHSGGNLTPDTHVFTLAFSTYFGVERALLPARPQPRAVDARARHAAQVRHRRRLARERATRRSTSGAALLVYPGGDYEVHRPTWESRRVDFDGRKGFIRARARAGRADRPGGLDRRPGDRAVPLARRAARASCWGSTACSA